MYSYNIIKNDTPNGEDKWGYGGDGFKPPWTHEQILRNYKNDSNRQIKIILLNNRRPLFRRAYRGGNVKIILILIEDDKQNSRKHEHIRQMIYMEQRTVLNRSEHTPQIIRIICGIKRIFCKFWKLVKKLRRNSLTFQFWYGIIWILI